MTDEFINVTLPKSVVKKIEGRLKDTGFASVNEYILYVLKEVLNDEEEKANLTEEEEAQVKETLKKLGYIKDEQA